MASARTTALLLRLGVSAALSLGTASPPLLPERALAELRQRSFVAIPAFLSRDLVDSLVDDVNLLRESPGAGRSASAHRGAVEWFELLPKAPPVPAEGGGRAALLQLVSGLQSSLEELSGTTLSEAHTELKYAFYPTGGFYQRHIDAMNVGRLAREWSFILYLNQGWRQSDGGHLRVFEAGSGVRGSGTLLADFTAGHSPLLSPAQHVDIAPRAGTLVVFRSDTVPHEVRHTSAKRMAIIGWLHRELGEAEAPAEPPEEELSELALALKRHYEGRGEKIKGFESVDAVSVPGE